MKQVGRENGGVTERLVVEGRKCNGQKRKQKRVESKI